MLRCSENAIRNIFRQGWPPGFLFPHRALEPSILGSCPLPVTAVAEEDKKSEGFLWGVPKRRRTVEKRWSRKIGAENWVLKVLLPKTNLRICETCGHHYENKHLCRNCYERIKMESEEIRKGAEDQIGDTPEDKGIVVLYENERGSTNESALKDKLVVELPKARPAWFSRNLLQRSTAGRDPHTTDVTVTPPKLG